MSPWTTAHQQASLCFTISWSWLRFMSNEVGDASQPSHPLLPSSPFVFSPSQHQVFSSKSVLRIRWPQYWSFSFSISPSSEYSGLISFRIDCFDLLAVQGTLKSLLQHRNSKASVLWISAFFMVQLSHPYRGCLSPGCFASHHYVRSSACATQGLGEFGDAQLRSVLT